MQTILKANYHTHTYLCNHASGTIEEYVKTAVAAGYKILGFADHTPYRFPGNYYNSIRMRTENQKIYVEEIERLKEKYKDIIQIYLGYEAEYYPGLFGDLLELLNSYPCDYIILGQHFTKNEYDGGVYVGESTYDIQILKQYVSQVCEGTRLGVFTYIAHPDLINYRGPIGEYLSHMEKIIIASVETDTPLELNIPRIWNSFDKPQEEFFKMAGKYGCKAIIGADAHSPEKLIPGEEYEKALEIAEKYSLNLLETVNLKTPYISGA